MMDIKSLLQINIFKGADEEALRLFLNETPNAVRSYPEGSYIAMQDDLVKSLYILYKGSARALMENAEGKQITIDTLYAPEVLAPAFIYASINRFPVNVEALTQCEIIAIDRQRFLQFMHEHMNVMQSFIKEISDRSQFLSRKLNEFALQSLKSRLIKYLQTNGKIANQQDVANLLGVARPSLARALSELVNEKKIRINDSKEIEIL